MALNKVQTCFYTGKVFANSTYLTFEYNNTKTLCGVWYADETQPIYLWTIMNMHYDFH